EDIWPWLVQIGYQRGGMYSYDWLDRLFGFLNRPSSNTILPEFQQLAVGDMIPWGHGDFLTVKALQPNHALVLELNAHGMDWVWQFGLYPVDVNRTRLVTRGIERTPTSIPLRLGMLATEPAAFIMTTRMLFGVKRRAEALRRSRAE
ncbi:SRPBCC family protein, partial [bacterium]|nr:SRPBCC family protein [bacterium]